MTTIRSASSADLRAAVDLWDRAGGPTRSPGRHLETARLLARDPEAVLVADRDGRVVAR
jgi:hypothetical protein